MAEDSDLEDLPEIDLHTPSKPYANFRKGLLVWVHWQNQFKWPAHINVVYRKIQKASVYFINCEQKAAIRVNFTKICPLSVFNYLDIYLEQRDHSEALRMAMEFANDFRKLKEEGKITESPKSFFSKSINEQSDILNRLLYNIQPDHSHNEIIKTEDTSADQPSKEDKHDVVSRTSPQFTWTSENALSPREEKKLLSAQKARNTDILRIIRYIKSPAALERLQKIALGEISSQRHSYFKKSRRTGSWWMDMASVYEPGIGIYNLGSKELDELIHFLHQVCLKWKFEFEADTQTRLEYTTLVVLPEATKEALRVVKKIPADKLEEVMLNGLANLPVEIKARRLEFEEEFFHR